jgi:hypothetical protein
MFPPRMDLNSKGKGKGGFTKIVIINDNLRVQPQ